MQYTLVITSSGRHEMLQQTLASFVASTDEVPRETIIVEDGPAERPEWLPRHNVRWLSNGVRRGQIYSIDRAYAEVKTPYIFHCEDDWLFLRPGYLHASAEILERYPDILQVWLLGVPTIAEIRDHFVIHRVEPHPTYPLQIAKYSWPGWRGGFSFNPGLRRLSDYQRIGSYGRHAGYDPQGCGERAIGSLYHSLGYNSAILPERHIGHLGDSVHVDRKQNPSAAKVLLAVPTADSLDYSRFREKQREKWGKVWENGVSGLQIDGPNARKKAVEETWWKDCAAHKNLTPWFFSVPGSDDHVSMPIKMRELCRAAVARDFDKMFRCDDDTWVHVDHLMRQGLEWDGDYAGVDQGGFIIGGPGIWMSRKAMQFVASADVPDWQSEWRDDAWMGDVLRSHGIKPGNDLPGLSIATETSVGQMITRHPVGPDEMRARYAEMVPLWKEDPNDLTEVCADRA